MRGHYMIATQVQQDSDADCRSELALTLCQLPACHKPTTRQCTTFDRSPANQLESARLCRAGKASGGQLGSCCSTSTDCARIELASKSSLVIVVQTLSRAIRALFKAVQSLTERKRERNRKIANQQSTIGVKAFCFASHCTPKFISSAGNQWTQRVKSKRALESLSTARRLPLSASIELPVSTQCRADEAVVRHLLDPLD